MADRQNAEPRQSRRSDWETFWRQKQDVDGVYSNADRIVRHLAAVIDLRGKRILEVGAGTGRDSLPLALIGAEVVQLDYADQSLRILQRRAQEEGLSVSVVGGDAFELPFRDRSFDVVFHQGLLEHFRPLRAEVMLREHIRVLKPGGLLLVDVPQRFHLYTVVKHLLIVLNRWFAGWERSFSIGELERLVLRLGLRPVRRYGEWMVPSFFYRAARELLKNIGIVLPLYPVVSPFLNRLRGSLRRSLLSTPLPLYTGISIGVIARKEET